MEDKQVICSLLLLALQETDGLGNLVSLDYNSEKEVVKAKYRNGFEVDINVFMDSGVAMIKDIVKVLSR